ncbi:hypothetical protein CN539_25430 [Bacillus toyonensis]|uniref:hypothetical protein n=1 Tax=Bacillus toyonensis TaxID=155322 RepID=UPI000BF04B19|nr:hypothetical protein [Bacillus toyonensis]PEN70004.1 hypothetical protein CN539_25430 [Bacillus toyonensis]
MQSNLIEIGNKEFVLTINTGEDLSFCKSSIIQQVLEHLEFIYELLIEIEGISDFKGISFPGYSLQFTLKYLLKERNCKETDLVNFMDFLKSNVN